MRCGQMNRCLDYIGFKMPPEDFSLNAIERLENAVNKVLLIFIAITWEVLKDNLGNLQR